MRTRLARVKAARATQAARDLRKEVEMFHAETATLYRRARWLQQTGRSVPRVVPRCGR